MRRMSAARRQRANQIVPKARCYRVLAVETFSRALQTRKRKPKAISFRSAPLLLARGRPKSAHTYAELAEGARMHSGWAPEAS